MAEGTPNGGVIGAGRAVTKVFISYAHDNAEHRERVRAFWLFLRGHGIDAALDVAAAVEPRDWTLWMGDQLRECDFVLVIGSPEYRKRAEGRAEADEGRGVQWEAGLIRDLLYRDQRAGRRRVLPVLLETATIDDLPDWLTPAIASHYRVPEPTLAGAEKLYRVLTSQPADVAPDLGLVVTLGQHQAPVVTAGLRSELLIRASVQGPVLVTEVSLAGTLLHERRETPLGAEVGRVWEALRIDPLVAGERMAAVGVALGAAVFEASSAALVARLVDGLRPGDGVDVVVHTSDAAVGLPWELLRLPTAGPAGSTGSLGESGAGDGPGASSVPLVLRAGVTFRRHIARPGGAPDPVGLAGPVKVLAAVAAPEETRTPNPPLDVEAEMQAVLGALTGLAGHEAAGLRILEVASLTQIGAALAADEYHVLHLSAHGSPAGVELEDEDGAPHPVGAATLMESVHHGGRPVPLIVVSACSGAAGASEAMAAELIRRGADRVIAMQAPVTDQYATALAAALYADLTEHPTHPVAQALARARWSVAHDPAHRTEQRARRPEWGIATVLCAGADLPLVDPALPRQPLTRPMVVPSGVGVRELPLGHLIGRRRQLREAAAILRRTPAAVQEWGQPGGVQLTGIGGIGKTAVAGRLIQRLREGGWLVAVHEGRWNPAALFTAVADQLTSVQALAGAAPQLRSAEVDERAKLAFVTELLGHERLLLVFDDFEQNLTPGGTDYADPGFAGLFAGLYTRAAAGAVLVTCRYPLPGADLDLIDLPLPGLSPAELGRLFLRLPALRDLPAEEQRLISRAIGGHPRLIEFVDALIRGRGASALRDVQTKLRTLAAAQNLDLRRPRRPGQAVSDAMLLGSADILLEPLLALLTGRQRDVLAQVAVSRAPMTLDDLAHTLTNPDQDQNQDDDPLATLRDDVERLAGLTLLAAPRNDGDLGMHPWTAELITRNTPDTDRGTGLQSRHERALAMRYRRFEQGRGAYEDLIEIPRHLAALGRYDEAAAAAEEAVEVLPGVLASTAYLAKVQPLIPTHERAWILLADLEIAALTAAGDLTAVGHLQDRIHEQIARRAGTDPANTEWQRDLSVSHNKLGDVAVAAGDLAAARAAFQAGLAIAERLAAADPANTGWQRDLSVNHERLGDVAVAAGDLAAARAAFQASLAIRERLAAADPANTGWQRDLSVSHERLGDVAVAAGDLAAARAAFQASLAIRELLAALDPENAQWARDLEFVRRRLSGLDGHRLTRVSAALRRIRRGRPR